MNLNKLRLLFKRVLEGAYMASPILMGIFLLVLHGLIFGFVDRRDNSSLVGMLSMAHKYGDFVVASLFAVFSAWFLFRLYKDRSIQNPLLLYVKIGLGAIAVPLFASWVTFVHYSRAPDQYLVPDGVRAQAQELVNSKDAERAKRIALNEMQTKSLFQVAVEIRNLPQSARHISLIKSHKCARGKVNLLNSSYSLQISSGNLIACVLHFPGADRFGGEDVVVWVLDRQNDEILVNFTNLLPRFESKCQLYGLFTEGRTLKALINGDDVLSCLDSIFLGLSEEANALKNEMEVSKTRPPFSLGYMILHQLARAVGADYKLYEPVGFVAGTLSVVWSLLLATYFFVFVAIVLSRETTRWDKADPEK